MRLLYDGRVQVSRVKFTRVVSYQLKKERSKSAKRWISGKLIQDQVGQTREEQRARVGKNKKSKQVLSAMRAKDWLTLENDVGQREQRVLLSLVEFTNGRRVGCGRMSAAKFTSGREKGCDQDGCHLPSFISGREKGGWNRNHLPSSE
ncbi:hypothetical protein M0R45_017833 [Rubus argutus]|uniref:Uncharacterized protein n=1 Tax=Rubus argutus TaxID=59490 RepID=A0AAW1XX27_RUBAR